MGNHASHPVRAGFLRIVVWSLISPLVGGCTGGGAVTLSPVQTAALGRAVQHARVIHEAVAPAINTDPELSAYVQELGKRLTEGARKIDPQRAALERMRIEFHLVNSPVVNAFSTGGEHVYVYTGLFVRCGTEEELAAAMAHALAHTTLLHLTKRKIEDPADPDKAAVFLANAIVASRFTPGEETEADSTGFQVYVRGGWDPSRFGDVYQRVGGREYNLRAQDPRRWAQQLSTSAQASRRSPVADERTFVQLQQRAKGAPPPPIQGDKYETANVILTSLPNCLTTDQPEQVAARQRLVQLLPQTASGKTDRELGTGFGPGRPRVP